MNNFKCPLCNSLCPVEHILPDLYLCFCKSCDHRFSLVSKSNDETYSEEYYLEKHKNWFNNPDYFLYNKILKIVNRNQPKSILDVGCGNANLLKYLRSNNSSCSLTGIDLSNVNKFDNVEIINEDFLQYEWEETYDFIVSLATIEHIDDINFYF